MTPWSYLGDEKNERAKKRKSEKSEKKGAEKTISAGAGKEKLESPVAKKSRDRRSPFEKDGEEGKELDCPVELSAGEPFPESGWGHVGGRAGEGERVRG